MNIRWKIIQLAFTFALAGVLSVAWWYNMELYDEIDHFNKTYGEVFHNASDKQHTFLFLTAIAGGLLFFVLILQLFSGWSLLHGINSKNKNLSFQDAEDPTGTTPKKSIAELTEAWVSERMAGWPVRMTEEQLFQSVAKAFEAWGGLYYRSVGDMLHASFTYALSPKELAYPVGASMPGQAFSGGDVLALTPLPEGIKIEGSGLGNTDPVAIIYLPLFRDQKPIGLMELALLHPAKEQEISNARALMKEAAKRLIKEEVHG